MKTNILLINSGLSGISNACIELSNRLQLLGYQVVNASIRDVASKYNDLEFSYVQFPLIAEDTIPKLPSSIKTKLGQWIFRLFNIAKRQQTADEAAYPHEFLKHIQSNEYDMIIVDMELHEYIISAYAFGENVILLSQWFSIWPLEGLPYILTDEMPDANSPQKSDEIARYWKKVEKSRKKIFRHKRLKSLGCDRRSVLLRLASRMKFPLNLIKKNFWPGPFIYDEIPVLSMTSEALEFPHQQRTDYFAIGPMVYEKRKLNEKKQFPEIEEELKKAQSSSKKIICCTLSTLKAGDSSFVIKVINACSRNQDWILFVGLGGMIDLEPSLQKDNIIIYPYLPQLSVLEKADISINHGGIHTINECIHFNVPILVYSGKRSDQNGCAARIEYHKIGMRGDKGMDTLEDIEFNVKSILSNKIYQNNMQEMHDSYGSAKDGDTLKKLINQLIKSE